MKEGKKVLQVMGVAALLAGVISLALGSAAVGIAAVVLGLCSQMAQILLDRHLTAQAAAREGALAGKLEEERVAGAAALEACRQAQAEKVRTWQSNVTHSLRMPFSVIMGYAELLEGDMVADDEARREYMQKIRARVSYLNNVLSQLLMETRVEAEMPACVLERGELVGLTRGVLKELGEVAQKKDVELRLLTVEETIEADVDVTQIRKIFYNVLENAFRYMGRPGAVTVTLSKVEEGEALLVIKDDGQGLPEEETAHIFDLNYQGSNQRGQGGGLGLHLVRNIVLAHGGTVTARSGLGSGLGLYIRLPLRHEGAENFKES